MVNVIATTALMREREFVIQISANMGNGNVTAVGAFQNLINAMVIEIVQTVVMRRRDVPIQAYAWITNGNVTTANAFQKTGMTTGNVIAKIAVMSFNEM